MKLCWRFYGFSQASRQLPSPLSPVMNGECLRPFNFFWISFSVGLHSFFKSFFKQNDPEEFYGLIKTKIDVQHPGGRLGKIMTYALTVARRSQMGQQISFGNVKHRRRTRHSRKSKKPTRKSLPSGFFLTAMRESSRKTFMRNWAEYVV